MEIVIATKNEGKVKEINGFFSDNDKIKFISLNSIGYTKEIIEDGNSFEENALIKARQVANDINMITLADDSGLEVDYLNGAPGIYSARFGGENTTHKEKISILLKELEGVDVSGRTARFVCVLALVFPNNNQIIVKDKCEGIIAMESKGDKGFGYDPIFYIPTLNKTMAEIDPKIKNTISHRAKALEKLKEQLKSY